MLAELDAALRGAVVVDAARVTGSDDLLLFVATPHGKRALHVAPGGPRARVCTTARRWPKGSFARGPQIDRLIEQLCGLRLEQVAQRTGDRSCAFALAEAERRATLVVELFGARGLWCVLDAEGRIVAMSRPLATSRRSLRPGDAYAPPAPAAAPPAGTPRFTPPICDSVDRHYTELDLRTELDADRLELERAVARAMRKLQARLDGLQRQQEEIGGAGEIRRDADLLLSYAFRVRRGDTELVVPDPYVPGAERRILLDPAVPAHAQADALYRRARKLENAAAVSAARRTAAEASLAELAALQAQLAPDATPEQRASVRERLTALGVLAPPRERPTPRAPAAKPVAGENVRRFTSAEGHAILVGRSNEQNDRLSLRIARGNDLWLHVGQGHAGSHVVVRLPRGKTASLETLLDAGTLAIHFSKARGSPLCEVVYTHAKHVRKPRGLPPGRVVAAHTKALRVRRDEARLRRLLDEGGRL